MNIGDKLKDLRIKNSLTQEELADRCELTKGFISQVERDLTSPSISTFVDILEGLGTNLKDFFNDDNKDEKLIFTKDDVFESENEELKYILKWLIPNAQKNTMEPILLDLEEGGQSKFQNPYEGEEFGYVLKGSVNLHIGDKKYRLKKGESFYYHADEGHYISNASKNKSQILWVSSPPNF